MLFVKKNKWIFVFISLAIFFFLCYTFYSVNGFIEGATTNPTAGSAIPGASKDFISKCDPKYKGGPIDKEACGVLNACADNTNNKTADNVLNCAAKTVTAMSDSLIIKTPKSVYFNYLGKNGASLKTQNCMKKFKTDTEKGSVNCIGTIFAGVNSGLTKTAGTYVK